MYLVTHLVTNRIHAIQLGNWRAFNREFQNLNGCPMINLWIFRPLLYRSNRQKKSEIFMHYCFGICWKFAQNVCHAYRIPVHVLRRIHATWRERRKKNHFEKKSNAMKKTPILMEKIALATFAVLFFFIVYARTTISFCSRFRSLVRWK